MILVNDVENAVDFLLSLDVAHHHLVALVQLLLAKLAVVIAI
jgi:hypothetical protein